MMGKISVPPIGVITALYSGISKNIDYLKKMNESTNWIDYHSTLVTRTREAIDWYKDNCLISTVYLEEAYDDLLKLIPHRFIYDGDKYYRYTLKYQLTNDSPIQENQNCLIERNVLLKDHIIEGHIVKAQNGLYIKISEVCETNSDYGTFIAEMMSVDELITMRKGG